MSLFGTDKAWITPSVTIAVLALLFTVGSFCWIQVRRGRLIVYPPSTYAGSSGSQKLVLILPLVFYNPAPAPIVVLGLRLKIESRTTSKRKANEASPTVGSADEQVLPALVYWHATNSVLYNPTNSGGWRVFASPFAVDGRRAAEKFIEFQWNPPLTRLGRGPYLVTIEVKTAHRSRWQATDSFLLNTQLSMDNREALIVRPNDIAWQP